MRLKLYELTWDPVTRWAKGNYVAPTERAFESRRHALNRNIKKLVVNNSLSDAVLYVGEFQHHMRWPILQSLCKILEHGRTKKPIIVGESESDQERLFKCVPSEILSHLQATNGFAEKNDIIIVTHSLGTRMLFDTLGTLSDENIVGGANRLLGLGITDTAKLVNEEQAAKGLITVFRNSLRTIFTLTNQIPLLELMRVNDRKDYINIRAEGNNLSGIAHLGIGFEKFIGICNGGASASRPVEIVAFTDRNDLLSYDLKCWFYLNVLRFDNSVHRHLQRISELLEGRSSIDYEEL